VEFVQLLETELKRAMVVTQQRTSSKHNKASINRTLTNQLSTSYNNLTHPLPLRSAVLNILLQFATFGGERETRKGLYRFGNHQSLLHGRAIPRVAYLRQHLLSFHAITTLSNFSTRNRHILLYSWLSTIF
jgi:hypothetical protein